MILQFALKGLHWFCESSDCNDSTSHKSECTDFKICRSNHNHLAIRKSDCNDSVSHTNNSNMSAFMKPIVVISQVTNVNEKGNCNDFMHYKRIIAMMPQYPKKQSWWYCKSQGDCKVCCHESCKSDHEATLPWVKPRVFPFLLPQPNGFNHRGEGATFTMIRLKISNKWGDTIFCSLMLSLCINICVKS